MHRSSPHPRVLVRIPGHVNNRSGVMLSYDGQGYWLAQKRLSKGRFVWWNEQATRSI
jgi:hypothetical protein